MKAINKLAFMFIVLCSSHTFGEPTRISDENVSFFYESRAEIPAPDDKLAGYISSDYRRARDEFTKHDLFQKIKPVLAKRLTEAKQTDSIILKIGGEIGDYDFEKKSFATGFGDTSFIPFDNGYAVSFANGSDIEFLSVQMEEARALSSQLRSSRKALFDIQGEIIGTKEKRLKWNANKIIEVKITKISIKLKSGKVVGEKSL